MGEGLMKVSGLLLTICGARKVVRRACLRLNPPFKFNVFTCVSAGTVLQAR